MAGIPPHREPKNQAELEIAEVMNFAHYLVEAIQEKKPELPPAAISAGLINYGTQIGCMHTDPLVVAEFLRNVAKLIEPTH